MGGPAVSNAVRIELPYKWIPRDYQFELWKALESGKKRAMLFWHRRAGKDLTMLNWIACAAMQRVGAYWHVFPTYRQGRKIAWEGSTREGRRFIDHFPPEIIQRVRDQEMTIDFVNGSTYSIVGADNPDSQVGTNPVGMVFSEYAVLDGDEIWIYLQPILAENDGWAIFITTPRGRNHAYRMYQEHKDDPEWFCQKLSYKDTGAISEEAVARAIREGMSPELAAQEFECSFDAALEHAWYGQEMKAALNEDRIGLFPHLKDFPVETWWDIGMNDQTAIWFAQKHMGAYRLIRYEAAIGMGHPHWMSVLSKHRDEHQYNYSEHLLPHDAEVTEWGTMQTRVERFFSSGIRNVRVVPKISVADGIGAVRSALSRCYFHEKDTKDGLEALRQYKRKPLVGQTDNNGNQVYSDQPLHDWASDGADAFRVGIVGSRPFRPESDDDEDILAPDLAIV
jgi:hypothetical protein